MQPNPTPQGRHKDGGTSAMAANRRLLSPLADPTVPKQLPSSEHLANLAGLWQQDAPAGPPGLPPTCPSGRYVVGHLVPITVDCGCPLLADHDAMADTDSEYYDYDLNAYDVRLSVCSDAFGSRDGASQPVLGPIYAASEEEAFSLVLDVARPSDAPQSYPGRPALQLWKGDGSVHQAFHFQCDVTAASSAGPEATEGRFVMVGDKCRIRQRDSGMCVVVDEVAAGLLPGQASMVLDDCAKPASNDGAMWRFCAVRKEAGGQQAVGGLRAPGQAAAH